MIVSLSVISRTTLQMTRLSLEVNFKKMISQVIKINTVTLKSLLRKPEQRLGMTVLWLQMMIFMTWISCPHRHLPPDHHPRAHHANHPNHAPESADAARSRKEKGLTPCHDRAYA